MNDQARRVFREGIAPQLSVYELLALQAGLQTNDPALIQGDTIRPLHHHTRNREPVACCPIAFSQWRSAGNLPGITVGEVEELFAGICHRCDLHFGEQRSTRPFLTFVDDSPREQMLRELLAEVVLALTARAMEMPAA